MHSQVSIIKCKSYNQLEVYNAIKKAIDFLGGINSFVKKEDKVLIKPNLLSASTPESGIVTHPEFVRAAVRLVKETGAEIFLGDNPSVWGTPEDVEGVYEVSGIKRIAEEEKINLIKLNRSILVNGYALSEYLKMCSCIISLPKFKTHDLMTLTGAIKNLFGMVPGLSKTQLHRQALDSASFAKILVDIYELTKPKLSIIDGIVAMEGDGPAAGGTLRDMNLVLAGSDAVSLDSILALIMGLKPEDILTTKEAKERGLGNAELKDFEIFGENLEDFITPDFKLPQTHFLNKMPKPILKTLKKLVRFYPKIDNDLCKMCEICAKSCPVGAISKRPQNMRIEYNRCIYCFCCQEVCPHAAVKVKKSFFTKIASGIYHVYSHYRLGK
ncbi:MAG: DUF362 domain-containing protein [Candidatus Omnitrophota bacterium]|nr:DUF362 domain-containing protein [Candidatus Omnitrophota bacterium]